MTVRAVEKLPEGYKQTEIGVTPADWSNDNLGNIMSVYRGGSPRPIQKYLTKKLDGINWIKIGDVVVGAKYIDRTDDKIIAEGEHYSRRVKKGDFLLSNSMSFGRPYILRVDGCIHDGWLVLQEYHDLFSQEFLYYILCSKIVIDQYIQKAAGSSVLNLNKELVSSILLPIPSLKEQKAIEQILSDVDVLLADIEKLIEKKKNIKQGTMQELLTGKRRLPRYSGKWGVKRLGELLEYEQPTKYLVKDTEYSDDDNIPVLTAGKTFILGYTSEETGIFSDLPVIIFDDFTTAIKFVDFPFKAKSSAMKMLRPKNKDVNLRYVYERMQLIDFRLGDHKRYWISEYQNIEIDNPEPDEQAAIAKVICDMDSEIEKLESELAKYKNIKQGMMQNLLTGKIRLNKKLWTTNQ